MKRYLCIHGHFYQPPRENPWLEAVEKQDGAYPYHDWNELITAECYAPNAASRMLDEKGRIKDIVSNYSRISFDMGPTLLSWLQINSPDIYEAILEADATSLKWRDGHGAAMAQCYNHMIMPLANSRDKRTQCIWGLRDFRHRFKRDPEGIWLPETAVDIETLTMLAEMGIKFTLLAQHQAKAIRAEGTNDFIDISDSQVDPAKAYKINLPGGASMAIFFYDGSVSQAVAFEGLLKSGETFWRRLQSGFSDERNFPQLMHIATDGESYGHHHRFGDMALAYALNNIESQNTATITNYGEFLGMHPPVDEVEIFEHTSWSCAHGTERWRTDCGCSSGGNPKWNQQWREPLRESLDQLRDNLSVLYEKNASPLLKDPWKARNDYISIILDRSLESVDSFMTRHAMHALTHHERARVLGLLEMERHAMLMFTSCGWFFDDISGIETVQILQYAGRAIQLAMGIAKDDATGIEDAFMEHLEVAKSNKPETSTGRAIYENLVKPSFVNLQKVAAHYAISSLFEEYSEEAQIYSYSIKQLDYRKHQSGRTELVVGHCFVSSTITEKSEELCFAVLHIGDHDFNCGISEFGNFESFDKLATEITDTFEQGSFAEVVRLIDSNFSSDSFNLKDLFKDEQRSVLDTIIKETLDTFEQAYRRMYDNNRILMGFIKDISMPVSKAFITAAEFILNHDLKYLLRENSDAQLIRANLDEFKKWNIELDTVELEFTFRRTLEREMGKLSETPTDLELLLNMVRLMDIALSLPFELNLWMMQNIYFTLSKNLYHSIIDQDSDEGRQWAEGFTSLGEKLNFNLDEILGK